MRTHRTSFAILGLGVLVLAGCLGGGSRDQAAANDSETATTHLRTTDCDVPLLSERVRVREIDVATDPNHPDRLAVGLIVSMPSVRNRAPHDWPFWDGLATTQDGGTAWKFTTLPGWHGDPNRALTPWPGAVFLTDPVVLFLQDGTLLYSGLAVESNAVTMFVSRYAPGSLVPQSTSIVVRSAITSTANAHQLHLGPPFTLYNDKQQLFEDSATGDLFVSWMWRTDFVPPGQRAQPMLSKSTDGGRTWSGPVPLYRDGHIDDTDGGMHMGAWPFVTLDGKLHAIWWDNKAKKLFQVDSPDRGASFGPPRVVADAPTTFGSPGGVIQLGIPSIDVDRSGGPFHGSVYVTWEDRRHGDRDVFVTYSRDNATSWSEPVRVNDDEAKNGKDQFLPQLTVEPSGAVTVLFMDRRNDPDNKVFLAYLGRSMDGGQTFANYPIASKPTDPALVENGDEATDPLGRTRLGDYNGVAYNRDGPVAVWQDGRDATAATHFSAAYLCRAVVV